MKRYIYFYDTRTIVPCADDEDAFNKIAITRKRTPDREWALIEKGDNDEYRVVAKSHGYINSSIGKTIIIVFALIALALIFTCAMYGLGILP